MCGIIGVKVRNKTEKLYANLFRIYKNQRMRGTDGGGIALLRNGNLGRRRVTDSDEIFSIKFLKLWKSIEEGDYIIIHHRMPTQGGDGKVIESNHPFLNEDRNLTLIHNGYLFNDDKLYEELKDEHHFESLIEKNGGEEITDSEVMLHLIEEQDTIADGIEDMVKKVSGKLAIAVMASDEKGIYLYKDEEPIETYRDEEGNVYFSSERPEGFKDVAELKEGRLYKLVENRVEKVRKIKEDSKFQENLWKSKDQRKFFWKYY